MIEKGPAIPEFIDRIARRRQRAGATATSTCCSSATGRTCRTRRRSTPPTRATTRSSSARSSTTSTPSRCAPTSTSTRCAPGLLEVTGRLFGLRYEPVADATVWHDGRHGVRRVSTPDGTRRCEPRPDLPRPAPARGQVQARRAVHAHRRRRRAAAARGCAGVQLLPGLMEHDHVVTLFHEFGHLVHHVLGGHVGWTRFSGVATEWDFVEAPSQMLEEWAWDADVLRTFATNAAGEPIPADLVDADARGRRLRQGPAGPARRCSTPSDVLLVPHRAAGRPDRASMRRAAGARTRRTAGSRTPTSSPTSATSAATRRRTTPTCGRW